MALKLFNHSAHSTGPGHREQGRGKKDNAEWKREDGGAKTDKGRCVRDEMKDQWRGIQHGKR